MRHRCNLNSNTTRNWFAPFFFTVAVLCGIGINSAPAQIFVGSGFTGTVGKYDTATGAAINENFITGLGSVEGLLISGNTLFTANASIVGAYDTTTGAAINSNFVTSVTAADSLALASNNLFVGYGGVGVFDATTGAAINPNLIPIAQNVTGVALSMDSSALFIVTSGGTIGKYNATTGAAINPNFLTIDGAWGLGVRGNILYVVNFSKGKIGKYDATTASPIDSSFITGLVNPTNVAFRGTNLFVTSSGDNSTGHIGYVSKYNVNTGELIKSNFIANLSFPIALAVVPATTATPAPTPIPTATPSPTPTATPDVTPTPTPTESPTPTPSPTVSPTPSPLPKTATPVILPIPGAYTKSVKVKITCATKGATIYYAVDLGVPTTSSPVYPKGKRSRVKIVGQGFHTIDAMALAPGFDQSDVAATTYRIK